MTVKVQQCVVVSCDGCGEDCWEDGTPHFDTVGEAFAYVRGAGFVVAGHVVWCPDCVHKRECARLGHTYVDPDVPDGSADEAWGSERTTEHGVPFRTRYCNGCGAADYDPPFDVLLTLDNAAKAASAGLTPEGGPP